ncbi:MAG: glyoxalase/bleomycin resistance/extradiol dioxygenase family protein [Alphaproteobacteria bacterium]|nr:glyoxalase/bleomycin resistance/extradiol dioxygenase family protein [Alphaproteobacteria bacterium]
MTDQNKAKGVIPNLTMAGRAREAINLWSKAFGAEEVMAFEENGRIRHAELRINGGAVYLTDFSQEPMAAFQPTPSMAMHLEVPDGSDWMLRAKTGGCEVMTPWHQQFWGGFGRIVDPFGIIWNIASPKPN